MEGDIFRKGIIGIILILLILLGVGLAFAFQMPSNSYKVDVTGTVYYDMIGGWGVTYKDSNIQLDRGIFSVLWYWPWTTKDILVVVELTGSNSYYGESWIGTVSNIVGSKDFMVSFRHVEPSSYNGKVFVYEIEKGMFWSETNRVLQTQTGFVVTIK